MAMVDTPEGREMNLRRVRYLFWRAVHDFLERCWHWVYYHKVKPVAPPTTVVKRDCILLESREPSESDKARGVERTDIYGSVD